MLLSINYSVFPSALTRQVLVIVFQLLKLWPQLVILSSTFSMASLFVSVLTFRSANYCLSKPIDCSYSAFLAAAAFRLSLSASHSALSLRNASLVASLALSQCLSSFCRSSTRTFWSKEFVLFNFSNCAHWFLQFHFSLQSSGPNIGGCQKF